MSTVHDRGGTQGPAPSEAQYLAVQSSEEFQELRRRLRTWVFPVTALFLSWYFLYVLLADYAHDFMSKKLVGNVNVGLLLGLLQFVSTFLITTLYVRFANRELDPRSTALRDDMERGAL